MSHVQFACTGCEAAMPPDAYTLHCPKCASPMDVAYTGGGAPRASEIKQVRALPAPLPLHKARNIVSLGEGNTPCVALPGIGEELGLRNLSGKLEYLAPTGSFKDRGATVLLSALKEAGITEIVEDSSGNAGASIAAYAARAGVAAHIFAPASAPQPKIRQLKVYGAHIHLIDGPREAATKAAMAYVAERGLSYASHNLSPYFLEGTKTFAYEIVEQFSAPPPAHIVIPVGNGSLLIGAWKGFQELRRAGRIATAPRLHAVQALAVRPIAAAFLGEVWRPASDATTIAGGISVSDPPRLAQALGVVQASGGTACAVSDDRIRHWQAILARNEGIFAEPTSAAAFAGLEALAQEGIIQPDDRVVVPVTGMGLKDAPPS